MQSEAETPLLRRLNGRPQACDPCRLRKVACDHTQPVCNRCRKRNQASACVYTIGSTTASASASTKVIASPKVTKKSSAPGRARLRPASSPVSSSLPAALSSYETHPAAHVAGSRRPTPRSDFEFGAPPSSNHPSGQYSTPSNESGCASGTTAVTTASPTQHRQHRYDSSSLASPTAPLLPPSRLGPLGFTSYSAVYEEARTRLSCLQGQPSPLPANDRLKPIRAGGFPWVMSAATRANCHALLRDLPDLDLAQAQANISFKNNDTWAQIAAGKILASFRTTLTHRSDSQIENLAQLMSTNTLKQVSDDLADPNDWIDQFVGPNLRWESLGLLFTFPELFSGGCGVEECASSWWHRISFKQAVLEWLDICLGLCLCMAGGNLMVLHICSKRSFLESVTLGDAGLECWRANADAVAVSTYLGLYTEPEQSNYTPTFCSELRRRLFAVAYTTDKVIASFQGRPPLLSNRYASTPPPLDISDKDYFAGNASLEKSIRALDKNGWKTTGDFSATTMIRARVIIAHVRDDLLEIALGSSKQPKVNTLIEIKAREAALIAELPPGLAYDPHELEDPRMNADTAYAKTLIQIEHLQNLFFAERLLQRYGQAQEGELLTISYEMVTLTLNFWIHKDSFTKARIDFQWLVMAYAAPGGGILCMELLKPTFSGPHPRDPKVTRSSIIQQLSLLVGFLSWVSPDAPNSTLCASCKTVIQHVLDHTLNNPQIESSSKPLEPFEQPDAYQPYFNFDLLDTFDWLRADDFIGDTL
ncbi:unnamed protein product [Clonostachys rhizophaga]|uniref:Zn(2)-C6 fungal-type domain-containing protein n=1 Tax=Clonostachys rhizophaga TaxID=160324 RepID=A0A9N9YLJ8_9HYPO|nr:unnamed protein product [Clonostachys rhizophaga]